MDGGAQSPRETRLRLILIDDGLPPRTQIRVSDGAHHATDRGQYVYDIGRAELIERCGWLDNRVVNEHSRRFILHRAHEAFARRGWQPPRWRA